MAPGFRLPDAGAMAAIDRSVVRSLGLERHGLEHHPAGGAHACAPTLDGRALVLWRERRGPSRRSARFRRRTPISTRGSSRASSAIAGVLRRVCEMAPPALDDPNAADIIELLKAGRKFRALGKADAYRLLRWMPMAVADLVGEWFESEPLRATIAAGGILGSFLGPWSAGSAAMLVLLGAGEGHPVATGWFAAAVPARWRTRWPPPRRRPASRFGPAPRWRESMSPTRRRAGSR